MDQIILDIMWSRLLSTVNEQAAAMMRSSFTSIVREAGDLSAGVFDRQGRMMAQAVTGTPGHINSMATGMVHILKEYPLENLMPGDVLITNDPWKTASQLNDITIATPVFHRDRLVAFFANTCHAMDIGGRGLSADSRSVYEEGIFIPVMKLHHAGQADQTLLKLLAANVRTPEEVLGDLHSQIVGNEVGARQLISFMEEFGLDDLEELSQEIIERSEAGMRQRISELVEGDYDFSLTIDGFEEPILINTRVTIEGDHLTVDFTGTTEAVPLGINVCMNYTMAYTTYGIKCAISPDVPNNEGSFRPVTVTAPQGCILNAEYPAAVGGRHLVGHFLPSAVMGAFAQALPGKIMAPGFDGLWDTHIAGQRLDGQQFSYTWFSAGGTGALKGQDGLSATAYPSGIAGVPVEVIETLAPLVIHSRELRTDSGGPGTFRGGLGQTMQIEVLTDKPYIFSGLYERTKFPAPGLHGGGPGLTGSIQTNNGIHIEPKVSSRVPADTVVTIELPGGGGFGPPAKRDVGLVREDVIDGFISPEAAQRDYGVVFKQGSLEIDQEATEALRKRMNQSGPIP